MRMSAHRLRGNYLVMQVFVTKNQLAKELSRDVRSLKERELTPAAILRLGTKTVPLFVPPVRPVTSNPK